MSASTTQQEVALLRQKWIDFAYTSANRNVLIKCCLNEMGLERIQMSICLVNSKFSVQFYIVISYLFIIRLLVAKFGYYFVHIEHIKL